MMGWRMGGVGGGLVGWVGDWWDEWKIGRES